MDREPLLLDCAGGCGDIIDVHAQGTLHGHGMVLDEVETDIGPNWVKGVYCVPCARQRWPELREAR